MSRKLVSVIIPCYNYAHYLEGCLESVFKQDHANLEVILVDDGSTDDTPEVAERYAGRLLYLRKENEGLSAARNTGLASATGDFIQFLDADDLLHPAAITKRLRCLGGVTGGDIAVCRNWIFRRYPNLGFAPPHWHLPARDLGVHLCFHNVAPPHSFLLTRSASDSIGLFDTTLTACEDYDYWLRGLSSGLRFASAPGRVYYRKHAQSMSANALAQWQSDLALHCRLAGRLPNIIAHLPSSAELAARFAFLAGALRILAKHEILVDRSAVAALEDSCVTVANDALAVITSSAQMDDAGLYYWFSCQQRLHGKRFASSVAGAVGNLLCAAQDVLAGRSGFSELARRCISTRSHFDAYSRLRVGRDLLRSLVSSR